jgi:DNA-binding CsgD family transcriptional regulator
MDRKVAFRKELREARGWMTDERIAEVVVRMASYGEIDPIDLRAQLAERRGERDGRRRFAVVDVDERHARALRICELWGKGVPEVEIAVRVGMSEGGFRTEKQKLRAMQYDLPLRRVAGLAA